MLRLDLGLGNVLGIHVVFGSMRDKITVIANVNGWVKGWVKLKPQLAVGKNGVKR